ncbi:Transposon Tf2-6 poly [Paramuricea clavata]|uniref:Transposon Tf2-6 poly n=1 Tax=Paramuricea clavata TaxID=317549 RepID=A0A6S7K605_PARCT|nr:Transposon Tf2-6 poly [Paramuricea clavata]
MAVLICSIIKWFKILHLATRKKLKRQRWVLYLQQFQYKLTYIRGKDNPADSFSRLPVDSAANTDAIDTEDFAYSVANGAMPVALASREVEHASESDATLKLVRQAVVTGDWSSLRGTKYKTLKDEFWIIGQVVMRGSRIVMPESLWKRTVELAHEGHQGIVRTKSRLREKVWWPEIDKQVEDYVRSCHPCQIVGGSKPKPEPIRSTKLPESPWKDISVDLLEITSESHLLVVVDYYSRWVEAILLRKTDAQHVIKSLEAIFRTHGLPETIRSDNGPPFASRDFEAFLKSLGIIHKKGVPYWPQSNGGVERCNETLLKIVRISRIEGKDWKKALEDFLFHYRVTPHIVTGTTPAELLMGRKLREKLPRVEVNESRVTETERKKLLKERDARVKLRQKEYADKRGPRLQH